MDEALYRRGHARTAFGTVADIISYDISSYDMISYHTMFHDSRVAASTNATNVERLFAHNVEVDKCIKTCPRAWLLKHYIRVGPPAAAAVELFGPGGVDPPRGCCRP